MRTYALVVDVSPSEQIIGAPSDFKVMSLLFGLTDDALECVGSDFPDSNKRLQLRKWAGARAQYKRNFVRHLHDLDGSGTVMFGFYVSNDSFIEEAGSDVWERVWGPFPKPTSFNAKGKPRIEIGGFEIDGQQVPDFTVLIDELKVLGWYAETLTVAHTSLVQRDGEDVELQVLIDRLPNDVGPKGNNKALLLAETCRRISDGGVKVVGIPKVSDYEQRDLLTDNLCGLFRELILANNSELYGDVESVIRVRRRGLLAPEPYRVSDVHCRLVFFRDVVNEKANDVYIASDAKGNEGYYRARHRLDGPAMITSDRRPHPVKGPTPLQWQLEWYVNGKICTKPVRDALVAKYEPIEGAFESKKTDYHLTIEALRFLQSTVGFGR